MKYFIYFNTSAWRGDAGITQNTESFPLSTTVYVLAYINNSVLEFYFSIRKETHMHSFTILICVHSIWVCFQTLMHTLCTLSLMLTMLATSLYCLQLLLLHFLVLCWQQKLFYMQVPLLVFIKIEGWKNLKIRKACWNIKNDDKCRPWYHFFPLDITFMFFPVTNAFLNTKKCLSLSFYCNI